MNRLRFRATTVDHWRKNQRRFVTSGEAVKRLISLGAHAPVIIERNPIKVTDEEDPQQPIVER